VSLNTSNASGINLGASNVQGATIVCFALGTLIATRSGEVAVETLVVGDLVMTLDHGLQPIRWIRFHDCPLDGVEQSPKPMLFAAGSLGEGVPEQDLIVSPNHRILVGGGGQLAIDFAEEALVAAKALTPLAGVRDMAGKRRITWVHFACDRHEVVTANGCLTESLLLGPMVLACLTAKERGDVEAIFGRKTALLDALNGPLARVCLPVQEVRRALKSHRRMSGARHIQVQGHRYLNKSWPIADRAGNAALRSHVVP